MHLELKVRVSPKMEDMWSERSPGINQKRKVPSVGRNGNLHTLSQDVGFDPGTKSE